MANTMLMESDNDVENDETLTKENSAPSSSLEVVVPHQQHNKDSVQVAVRVRPLLTREASRCLHCSETLIQLGGSSGPRFTYDHVFDSPTRQLDIFDSRCVHLLESCLLGYNATILAYGQTGSGKTFTMIGGDGEEAGIIPRALVRLFQELKERPQVDAVVRLQFLEVYGEDIRDLLTTSSTAAAAAANDKLTIRDLGGSHEPEVVGATQVVVTTAGEAIKCLNHGMLRRVTAATAMNTGSSRSHALLSVLLEQRQIGEQDGWTKSSKFNFVDLAGSERLKRTQAEGKRMKEGIDINKGLLVLGNVISALGDPKKRGKTFVPYRDSKLTRLLKGSLGGNHKTLMIACVRYVLKSGDEPPLPHKIFLHCLRSIVPRKITWKNR